jgi:HAD superfamily hydrolase (TIGR01509 family)
MAMRALVLDFDGVVIDTETTDFESWLAVYEHFAVELPRDEWVARIGSSGGAFNPGARLSVATGRPEQELRKRRREIRDTLVADLHPLPGVREWLQEAAALGLRVGIASSSDFGWVKGHLKRVGLAEHFDVIATADDVDRVKPEPAVYRLVLERLGVAPEEALAVEDSPNGLAAARAAGVVCVVVPGPMTVGLNFEGAHLLMRSLQDRSLSSVLRELYAAV